MDKAKKRKEKDKIETSLCRTQGWSFQCKLILKIVGREPNRRIDWSSPRVTSMPKDVLPIRGHPKKNTGQPRMGSDTTVADFSTQNKEQK